jgi:hypothetical protein
MGASMNPTSERLPLAHVLRIYGATMTKPPEPPTLFQPDPTEPEVPPIGEDGTQEGLGEVPDLRPDDPRPDGLRRPHEGMPRVKGCGCIPERWAPRIVVG